MTPSPQTISDPAVLWSNARRLYPIYAELAREFVIEAPAGNEFDIHGLESREEVPSAEAVRQAAQWLNAMDDRIQVHQLRQFLQTCSIVDRAGLEVLLQHFLAKSERNDAVRDKIDFLLVQYFSQDAPTELEDDKADIAYVAQGLKPVLGEVELKTPVWLNSLDRVLEAARRCRSLDELLHGGVLEQGRKAKAQAGDLFYLPIALVAFTRFGYLMRRAFFRLMLADLNEILDGLTALEEQGVEIIDCQRAQFSAQEPIIRLRMICQSWKVMFQAEYSSGQPLRMLVDLRASVDFALGKKVSAQDSKKQDSAKEDTAETAAPVEAMSVPAKPAPAKAAGAPRAAAAAAGAGGAKPVTSAKPGPAAEVKAKAKFAAAGDEAAEFDVDAAPPEWNPDAEPQFGKKK